jgi:hypothetical protein
VDRDRAQLCCLIQAALVLSAWAASASGSIGVVLRTEFIDLLSFEIVIDRTSSASRRYPVWAGRADTATSKEAGGLFGYRPTGDHPG